MTTERPELVEDQHLTYLDNLRKTGVTNMHGAASYLVGRFSLQRKDARTILTYWMESFEERHPA